MLELVEVSAGYDETNVLFGVSLNVSEGEVVSLVGRNGAGKSTILKTIVGMTRRNAGTLRFAGCDLSGMPTYRIARLGIGYVPEERRIFPRLTVEENLRVTRQLGEDRGIWSLERVYELFPALAELRRRSGELLSGGEQQMLCIARTLMGNPRLLLLDEPSEGLAPLVIEALQHQIVRLKQAGLTILLCEQHTGFARALSDRVYVIDRGTLWFEGSFAALDRDIEVQRRHFFIGGGALQATVSGRGAMRRPC